MRTALIIAHGSDRDDNGNAAEFQARRIANSMNTRTSFVTKDCDPEDLHRKMSYLAKGDVEEIVVIPLFFASSAFSEKMVPEMIGLEAGDRGGCVEIDGKKVKIRIVKPFGTDPHMRGVLGGVLGRFEAEPGKTAVILVGHGSKDGSNAKAMEFNAGIIGEFGCDAFPCYNEMSEPTVEQCLEDVLSKGFDDIVVIPMFVSSSHHSVVEIPEKLGLENGARERTFERDGRQVRIRYSTEIGLEPGVSGILCKMIEF